MHYINLIILAAVYIAYVKSKYNGVISFYFAHKESYHKDVDTVLNHLIGKYQAGQIKAELKDNKILFSTNSVVTISPISYFDYGILTKHHGSTEHPFCMHRCSVKMFFELRKFVQELHDEKLTKDIIYPTTEK